MTTEVISVFGSQLRWQVVSNNLDLYQTLDDFDLMMQIPRSFTKPASKDQFDTANLHKRMRNAGFSDPFNTVYTGPNEYYEATDDYEREEREREAQQRLDFIESSPAFKKLKIDPVLNMRTELATDKLMEKMYNLVRDDAALPDKFDEFCTHYFYTKHHGLELRVVESNFDERILLCVKGTFVPVLFIDDDGEIERDDEEDIEITTSSIDDECMQKRVENLKTIISILKLECSEPNHMTIVSYMNFM